MAGRGNLPLQGVGWNMGLSMVVVAESIVTILVTVTAPVYVSGLADDGAGEGEE